GHTTAPRTESTPAKGSPACNSRRGAECRAWMRTASGRPPRRPRRHARCPRRSPASISRWPKRSSFSAGPAVRGSMTKQRFVIVGGGLAGGTAAMTLRHHGFDGEVILVGAEAHPPYSRPPLSKEHHRAERPIADHSVDPQAR